MANPARCSDVNLCERPNAKTDCLWRDKPNLCVLLGGSGEDARDWRERTPGGLDLLADRSREGDGSRRIAVNQDAVRSHREGLAVIGQDGALSEQAPDAVEHGRLVVDDGVRQPT